MAALKSDFFPYFFMLWQLRLPSSIQKNIR